jgi:hypothetical protein
MAAKIAIDHFVRNKFCLQLIAILLRTYSLHILRYGMRNCAVLALRSGEDLEHCATVGCTAASGGGTPERAEFFAEQRCHGESSVTTLSGKAVEDGLRPGIALNGWRRQLENCPTPPAPILGGRAVEIALAIANQAGLGLCSVKATRLGAKAVQHGFRPASSLPRQLKHGAHVGRATELRNAVKVPVPVKHQPASGVRSVPRALEDV